MRIRCIKPEFWQDETVSAWPMVSRLAYIGLWNEADDAGRLRANPSYLRSRIFPYDIDVNMKEALEPIIASGKMVVYHAHGQLYAYLPKFSEHQVINRKSLSRIPAPDDGSVNAHGWLTEGSMSDHGTLTPGREGKGREQGREGSREGKRVEPAAAAQASPGSGRLEAAAPAGPQSTDDALLATWSAPGAKIIDVLRHYRCMFELNGDPLEQEWREVTRGQKAADVAEVFMANGGKLNLPSKYRKARKDFESGDAA